MMNGVSFLYLYNLYNTYGRQPESNASASSPIVFSWLFAGPVWSIAYVIAFGLSVWSSLVLKRHKKTDILAGVACMLTGFLLSFSLAVMSGWLP